MRYQSANAAILVAGILAVASSYLQSPSAMARAAEEGNDEGTRIEDVRAKIDNLSEEALETLFENDASAEELFDKASGYAVFDTKKAGLIITGGAGTGVAVNRASGERTYMRMGTGGIGLGAGVQSLHLIIFFETEDALNAFVDDGSWDSTFSAQAAAGKAGKNFASSFVDGIAVFQLTDKGLMAQVDLTGTRFWVSDELNPAS